MNERELLVQAKALIAPPTLKGEFVIPPKGPARKRYYKKLDKIKKWLRKQQQ